MDKKFTIKERILQLAKYKGFTLEEFCSNIGLTYGNFKGNAKNTPINSDSLANILSIIPDVNPTWLLTGEGEMLRTPVIQPEGQPPPKNEVKTEATAPPACALCAEKERVIATQQKLIEDKDKIIALLEAQLKECRESKAKRGASAVESDNRTNVKLNK